MSELCVAGWSIFERHKRDSYHSKWISSRDEIKAKVTFYLTFLNLTLVMEIVSGNLTLLNFSWGARWQRTLLAGLNGHCPL